MGWRDVLRKYGPAIFTAVLDTATGKPAPESPRMPAPVTEPEVIVPPPAQPVESLADRDFRMRRKVDDIYFEILHRETSKADGGNEMREGLILLEAGREDELRKNLRGKL